MPSLGRNVVLVVGGVAVGVAASWFFQREDREADIAEHRARDAEGLERSRPAGTDREAVDLRRRVRRVRENVVNDLGPSERSQIGR